MPIPFLYSVWTEGLPAWVPDAARDPWLVTKVVVVLGVLFMIKRYSSGFLNPADRNMHGRVVMITGGTSGVGAVTARTLASKGAQVVLLTRLPASNPFLADYVGALREQTGNQMIYAEQVDLASLHSIRQFATRWIDNAPPRRLDMIILCGSTLTPPGGSRSLTEEGVEETWMVNFLANFHLLGILSPALRAQPIDRDVRVILPTCSAYIGSPPLADALDKSRWTPGTAYARSKLALMVFGHAFQKHLDAYERPDKLPNNTRVIFADPGLSRTPGMRRWLTRGSVWGLLAYVLAYPLPWLVLKSADMGAQSVLFAAMDSELGRGAGGRLIKECQEVDYARKDVRDEEMAKKLWEHSDALVERTEKEQAARRAQRKKDDELAEKRRKEAEKAAEVESLVGAIKKGKEGEKKTSRRKGGKKSGAEA